jgi:hypothetical protein
MNNTVIDFLLLNGFEQITSMRFKNKKCVVTVFPDCYLVHYFAKTIGFCDWHSEDTNIYTLIGYLTYNKLITKRYKSV